jgi:two-component system, NarL family, nitrate/nitrite response regulator NarL
LNKRLEWFTTQKPSRGDSVGPDCGRILIVDSDEGFRALVSNLLDRAGYASVETVNGLDALVAVRAERPALVLLDISLPDINGYEVCHELRDEFGEELPIIFVSGDRVAPVDRAVGLLIGADDYVTKPFDADEFLARVRRAIVRSHPERTTVAISRDLGLTKREIEVLEGLAEGLKGVEIAAKLVISPKTVGSHVQRILAKLGVHSRAHAVALAYQSGLLESNEAQRERAVAG